MNEQLSITPLVSASPVRRMRRDKLILSVFGYIALLFVAVSCLLPFVLVLSSSLSSEKSIMEHGFQLIPRAFSGEAYSTLFKYPDQMLKAYAVTIGVTATGTFLGLFLTSMSAYVLARKDFKWRGHFSFFFFFTTLFNGGLVPFYLLIVNYLDLRNSFFVLIIPSLLNVFNILVMKSFINGIPDAITESARIDGASDFLIYFRLILPLSKPALATIGLFIALGYWNDWFQALLFMSDENLYPLQYYLYKMLSNMEGIRKAMLMSGVVVNAKLPTESLKMAMTIVAIGPILLVYPFIQRYFVQGLTVGSVKG